MCMELQTLGLSGRILILIGQDSLLLHNPFKQITLAQ